MKRLVASAFLVLGLLGVAMPIAGAGAARRIYVASRACTGHTWKPRSIIITCGDANFSATRLRYSSYGGAQAKATGVLRNNDCSPNCAAGHFISYAGSVTLGGVKSCRGRLYYERIAWRFRGARPFRNGSQAIVPIGCT